MAHLVDGLLFDVLRVFFVAPVFRHLGVEEILVDGGELVSQRFVQMLEDGLIPLHGQRFYKETRRVNKNLCGGPRSARRAAVHYHGDDDSASF